MTHSMTPIRDMYAMAYRRAECESGMLCMIYAANREHALEAMATAVQLYAGKGVIVKLDADKMDVCLPNGSSIHYGYPKALRGLEV